MTNHAALVSWRIHGSILGSSAQWMTGSRRHDPLARQLGPLAEVSEWETFLRVTADDPSAVRKHARTGRPLGDDAFATSVEKVLGRRLCKSNPSESSQR